jgi:ABC-type antimicrobial peptide transport system permease subunit
MLKNYFKTAWRSLVNNKVYSALNIFGLAIGMAVALLIGLWVYYQFSYDRFLPGYESVYSAKIRYTTNGETGVGPATPSPLADAIRKDIPGVQYVAHTDWMGPHSLVVGDKKLYQSGAMAGSDFLNIFSYTLIKGNANDALREPYSIVLSQATAKALFGDADPINKKVRIDNSHDLNVTAVMKDVPENSTLQFSYVVPFSFYESSEDWVKQAATVWQNNSFQTFVSLKPNVSYKKIAIPIKDLIKKYNPEGYKSFKTEVFLQPMKDWHLYTDFKNGVAARGLIDYVKMFSIIGLLILLIACINFMNLSTARSEKRAREVGIRKAIGSQRRNLILQFLIESIAVTFIAFMISILLVQLALPSFNMLTKTNITIPWSNAYFWLIMLSYTLLTGLLSGSRPAFYLSGFQPVKILKGSIKTGKGAILSRKILVITQFTCSIALIISTIVVYQQIQHAKDRPVGYNINRLLFTDASNDLNRSYDALKNDILQSGAVSSVTRSSSPVTAIWSNSGIQQWSGQLPGETLGLATIGVCDADYFKTVGMNIKEGRNFTGTTSDSLSVILNEAAVKRMRYKQPLNQVIIFSGSDQKLRVVGVVNDALMASPFAPAEPTIFTYAPGWSNVITYRLSNAVSTQKAIAKLSGIFNKYNPSYPFQYHFANETYAAKFSMETLIGSLAGLFALLAVFISCLGLFGLAAYMAEQRTKEIGIRKVLGASIPQIWLLLSKEFIVLVLLSCIIAAPVALYFLNGWLQHYDYRISVSPFVFVLAGVAAILITVITISFQAIKAAIANPVKSLRTE